MKHRMCSRESLTLTALLLGYECQASTCNPLLRHALC
jgi:hypothetical protein